jgi:hypothetical protein
MKHRIIAAAFLEKERNKELLSDLEKKRQDGSVSARNYAGRQAVYHHKMTRAVIQIAEVKNQIKQQILKLKIEINKQRTELDNSINDTNKGIINSTKSYNVEKRINGLIKNAHREILSLEHLLEAKTYGDIIAAQGPAAHNSRLPASWKWILSIAAIVLIIIFGGILSLAINGVLPLKTVDPEKKPSISSTDNSSVAFSWIEIVVRVKPSTVLLIVENQQGRLSSGSGMIIHHDGYILTCLHVIEGARSITVLIPQGGKYQGLVAGDNRNADIALIKIEPANEELPAVTLGDSDLARSGQEVIAMGYPLFGEVGDAQDPTISQGIVSAIRKDKTGITYLQTDAPLSPGNSGGALVNTRGEIIGMPTLKIVQEGVDGIGFALAINEAKPLIDRVLEKLSKQGK